MAESSHPPADHSAHYLFLIVGAPLAAFLIAASRAFETHGLTIPLVRITTGIAGLMLQAIPFMMLGALMSAAVTTFVSESLIRRHIPHSTFGGLAIGLLTGLCLPVCDCMVVPTFASIVRKRMPLPCAVTFLTAVPVTNPIAIWSTWYAFPDKPWMVLWRTGLGMIIAVTVGASFALWPPKSSATATDYANRTDYADYAIKNRTACTRHADDACCGTGLGDDARKMTDDPPIIRFLRCTHHDFLRMMPILLFSAIIASLARTYIRPSANGLDTSTLASILAIILAMGLAFLCSLCSSSDAVIASSMVGVLPQSALIAFLTFGPVLDLKNTLMLISACRPRFVIRFIGTFAITCFTAVCIAQHWMPGA